VDLKKAAPSELCRRLADGWTAEHADAPREFFARLRTRWQAQVETETPAASAFCAVMAVNQIRLLGASELGCLLLGPGAAVEREVCDFWQKHGGGGRLAFVLAATSALREAAKRFAPPDRCVCLGDGELEELLIQPHPLEQLKELLRRHIPLRRLAPYDIMHPVAPNMFFGRRDLLDRLHDEETTSFAIAGPGRIGKSSLLKQYRYELRSRTWDERRHRLFFIDCYPYGDLGSDAQAQRLALEMSADSEAYRVNVQTLLRFLKRRSQDGHAPLELLLDEVDCVCRSPTFGSLGEAVRLNYCRVVMCGRGNLYRLMQDGTHQFEDRLELLLPEPLDPESAEQLLFEPLSHLGIKLDDAVAVRQSVFELTALRPSLIQTSARFLFGLAQKDESRTVRQSHLQKLKERFLARSHAMLALKDMQDDLTQLMALLWLCEGRGDVTVGAFQRLADKHHVRLTAEKALEICDDLWICNVLIRQAGVLMPASRHLVEFVRKMDFHLEISRLKQALLPASANNVSYRT
jgi:hypothetical protein